MPLNAKQQQAILLLTLGVSKTQTADRCNVARSTLDLWLKDPEFHSAYEARLQNHLTATEQNIRTLARESIESMVVAQRLLRGAVCENDASAYLRTMCARLLVKEGRNWLTRLGFDSTAWDPEVEIAREQREAKEALESPRCDPKPTTAPPGKPEPQAAATSARPPASVPVAPVPLPVNGEGLGVGSKSPNPPAPLAKAS